MKKADSIQAYVCIPRELHERVKKHKKRNERTMNKEIIYLLNRALEIEESEELKRA